MMMWRRDRQTDIQTDNDVEGRQTDRQTGRERDISVAVLFTY